MGKHSMWAAAISHTNAIFRPYVDEYLGIEHESTFYATAAKLGGSRPTIFYDGLICLSTTAHSIPY
jgi:hypothetical protein